MAFREPDTLTMRQLLAAMAQEYCAAASWLVAAGHLDEAVRMLEEAVKALNERDHFVGISHEG